MKLLGRLSVRARVWMCVVVSLLDCNICCGMEPWSWGLVVTDISGTQEQSHWKSTQFGDDFFFVSPTMNMHLVGVSIAQLQK